MSPARPRRVSRAPMRWRRRSAANPQVKLSLEQVALLEGRITEAKADALPDITWTSFAMRSRDPGLLNSPNFDEFPPEFREALSPIPANAFWTTADFRQTIFSFKLGEALEAARLARRGGRARSAARASGDRARRRPRLQPAAVRDRSSCVCIDSNVHRSRATWTSRETGVRPVRPPSSRCCARRSTSKTSAPRPIGRRIRSRRRRARRSTP